jgi:hypothetical protein
LKSDLASTITGSIGIPATPPALLISSIAYCITRVESSSGTAKPPESENNSPTLMGSPFLIHDCAPHA